MDVSNDNEQKESYKSNNFQLQNQSSTFLVENYSLTSANSVLSMDHNTTDSLDWLTCTDYVDLRKCQERSGRLSCPKDDSNYLDVKLKVVRSDNIDFRLIQNLTMRDVDFIQLTSLWINLVIAANAFGR